MNGKLSPWPDSPWMYLLYTMCETPFEHTRCMNKRNPRRNLWVNINRTKIAIMHRFGKCTVCFRKSYLPSPSHLHKLKKNILERGLLILFHLTTILAYMTCWKNVPHEKLERQKTLQTSVCSSKSYIPQVLPDLAHKKLYSVRGVDFWESFGISPKACRISVFVPNEDKAAVEHRFLLCKCTSMCFFSRFFVWNIDFFFSMSLISYVFWTNEKFASRDICQREVKRPERSLGSIFKEKHHKNAEIFFASAAARIGTLKHNILFLMRGSKMQAFARLYDSRGSGF